MSEKTFTAKNRKCRQDQLARGNLDHTMKKFGNLFLRERKRKHLRAFENLLGQQTVCGLQKFSLGSP